MVVSWLQPTAGQPHGPGFQFQVSTSVLGPWPTGSTLQLDVIHDETGQGVYSSLYDLTSSSVVDVQGNFTSNELVPRLYSHVPIGAAATLHATFRSSVEGVVDSGTVSVQWQPMLGAPYVLYQQLLRMQSTGSFTAADRDELEVIHAAVNPVFAPTVAGGVALVARLGDLVSKPPPEFLMRSDPILISGTGVLTRPLPGVPVAAYGFHWTWHTIPPGFGLELGVPDEYQRRVVQFGVIVANRDGSEHYAVIADANSENQQITWRAPWPQRVMYSVAPGAVVSFRWLLLSPLVA